jgi:hypothetical protein
MKLVEVVSESIVKIDSQRLSSHGHRHEALSVVTKLKPVFRLPFPQALEGLGACSARDEMNSAAATE